MKNPAVLFYTSDFITGTLFMSNEEVGAYIRLLCMQHQKGHLTINEIKQICRDEKVLNIVITKFEVDEDGLYFNNRMDLEKEKRNKYSESRANNRKKKEEKDMKKICKRYDEDMENENENINNIYNNISNNNINNNSNIKDNRVLGEEEKKVKHCYGEFKRVKLTDKEYNKLIEDFGEDIIKEKIKQLDEYVEENNNKNKYTNFNLVIRKAIRNNWFKNKNEEKGYERKIVKDEDGAFHF